MPARCPPIHPHPVHQARRIHPAPAVSPLAAQPQAQAAAVAAALAACPLSESGSAGASLEDLDQALDESLEGFDDNVGGQGSDSAEIDILSPTGGGGGVQSDSEAPLFEEAGAMAEANAEIENRAAEGPGADSADSAGTDGAPEGQDQVGEGSPGTADNDLIPIPEDIDDGQGDDIVLRQIRDAAMKEKDPVLREKLWDEYRRIKDQ